MKHVLAIPLAASLLLVTSCGSSSPASAPADDTSASRGFLTSQQVLETFKDRKAGFLPEASGSEEDLGIVPWDELIADVERETGGLSALDTVEESVSVTPIDLRGFDTAVRSQGTRGTCTAFATVAAMEHHAKRSGLELNLSEEHLWSLYALPNTQRALNAAVGEFLVEESVWRYNAEAPEASLLTAKGRVKMRAARASVTTVSAVNAALTRGNPLVIAARVTTALSTPPADGVLAPDKPNTEGGHAMLVVGIQKDEETADYTGGGYYILKNSWGATRGDKGYLYMPFNYCDADTYCYFWEIPGVETRAAE